MHLLFAKLRIFSGIFARGWSILKRGNLSVLPLKAINQICITLVLETPGSYILVKNIFFTYLIPWHPEKFPIRIFGRVLGIKYPPPPQWRGKPLVGKKFLYIMYFGLQDTKPPPCPLRLTEQGGSIH
jgi:hypothetical protein